MDKSVLQSDEVNEGIIGVLWWFSHMERMENDSITKSLCRSMCRSLSGYSTEEMD